MRSKREPIPLPDEHFLARRDLMVLLRAVAAGDVVRTGPHASAPYLLAGVDVGSHISVLARYDIVRQPMSGPPTIEPRGQRLLAAAGL